MKKPKLINLDLDLIEALGDINVSQLFNDYGWAYLKDLADKAKFNDKELKRIKGIKCPEVLKEYLIGCDYEPDSLAIDFIRRTNNIRPGVWTCYKVRDTWRKIHEVKS